VPKDAPDFIRGYQAKGLAYPIDPSTVQRPRGSAAKEPAVPAFGFPILVNAAMPPDEMWFVRDGKIALRVVGLRQE
jgi:hypothetical protein